MTKKSNGANPIKKRVPPVPSKERVRSMNAASKTRTSNQWEFPFVTVSEDPDIFLAEEEDLIRNWEPIVAEAMAALRRQHIDFTLEFDNVNGFHLKFNIFAIGEISRLPLHREYLSEHVSELLLLTLQKIAELDVALKRQQEKAARRLKAIESLEDWQREALDL